MGKAVAGGTEALPGHRKHVGKLQMSGLRGQRLRPSLHAAQLCWGSGRRRSGAKGEGSTAEQGWGLSSLEPPSTTSRCTALASFDVQRHERSFTLRQTDKGTKARKLSQRHWVTADREKTYLPMLTLQSFLRCHVACSSFLI